MELKAVEQVLGIHHAQLLTYMKLAGIRTGLLRQLNVPMLKDGLQRLVMCESLRALRGSPSVGRPGNRAPRRCPRT